MPSRPAFPSAASSPWGNLLKELQNKVNGLMLHNIELTKRNRYQARSIVDAQSEIKALKQRNKKLQKRIDPLAEDLRIARLPANSSNSSRPPSTDLYPPDRNRSLRQSCGRKSGGQPGHRGSTLEFNSTQPNQVVEHKADYCSACGKSLQGVAQKVEQVRQIIDIPKPKPVIINHLLICRVCSCGHCTKGRFPGNVRSSLRYGPGVAALLVNLSGRQYIPYGRSTEFLSDLFGLNLSQGTVDNILARFSNKAQQVYSYIHGQISKAVVVGSDETGIRVNGNKGWFHTYQNPEWTFVGYHGCRGTEAQQAFFPQGLPQAVLVSDCWASQLSTPAAGHQACLSHLMRELKAMRQAHPTRQWPEKINTLFHQALELGKTGEQGAADVQKMERRFRKLLKQDQSAAPGKIPAFWKRMNKHSDKIFTFLHDCRVPADNNGSERAIRNVKVKQKISGQFRTSQGAIRYALQRFIIDTLVKQGKNVHESLMKIAALESG